MFKKFHGFHLLESHHNEQVKRLNERLPQHLKSTAIKAAVVILATLLIWNLPSTSFGIEGLTVVQQRIIAIFAFATLAWVLEVVPAWATSVTVIGLLLIFTSDSGFILMCDPEKVGTLLSYKSVMATFADPVIMLFIGGFILAIAAGKTGIDAHLAKVLLKPFGSKSENVLLGFLLITGLFSMFVSNTATAAMMLTFLAPMFKQLPPEGLNLGIGFGEWMMFMFPLVVVLLLLSWFIIKKLYPFTQKTIELKIEGELKHNFKTKVVIVTFILTVALWLLDSVSGINSYTVALVPFMIFSLTGVIDRRDLEEINCKLNVIGGTPTVLISVAVAASSAMVLPISTPPNALAFATNLISQKDMARIGLIIGIMSMVLGISMLYLLGTMHLI